MVWNVIEDHDGERRSDRPSSDGDESHHQHLASRTTTSLYVPREESPHHQEEHVEAHTDRHHGHRGGEGDLIHSL